MVKTGLEPNQKDLTQYILTYPSPYIISHKKIVDTKQKELEQLLKIVKID